MKNYEEMTVKELREVTKNRGLKQSNHDRKFTKNELIENLKEYDKKNDEDAHETSESNKGDAVVKEKTQGSFHKCENTEYIKFAHTLKEIKAKYKRRKPSYIYKYVLQPDCEVAFIHVVEKDDAREFYEKVRIAKVTDVDKATETVRVQMYWGEEFDISYDDILFIKDTEEGSRFPFDIIKYIRKGYSRSWLEGMKNEPTVS